MMSILGDYAAVALIGSLLGFCELLSRYRDEPWQAIFNGSAALYVSINAIAALFALLLLNAFDVRFGIDPKTAELKLRLVLILAAGLGAMAIFRSSLFTFKIGDKDVPLGPGLVLQILLDVTDRAVDRGRAAPRAIAVTTIMADIKFDKARTALPAYCFGLMQNVSTEEQVAIGQQVTGLGTADTSPVTRSLLLGLLLMNVVGGTVLKAAIESLGDEIR